MDESHTTYTITVKVPNRLISTEDGGRETHENIGEAFSEVADIEWEWTISNGMFSYSSDMF